MRLSGAPIGLRRDWLLATRRPAEPSLLLAAVPGVAQAQVVLPEGLRRGRRGTGYPQTTANDDTQVVGEALLRYEAAARPASWLRLNGSIDARADTHEQTEWDGISWSDRSLKRPGLAVRRLDATLTRGPLNLQVGKQFVRWGKTDILNPTDRFAPRDYMTVVDSEFLAVTAARFTAGLQSDTLDVVAARFTPSRTPLVDQRWAGLTADLENVTLTDNGAEYPGPHAVRRALEPCRAGLRVRDIRIQRQQQPAPDRVGCAAVAWRHPAPARGLTAGQRRACRLAGADYPSVSRHVDGGR